MFGKARGSSRMRWVWNTLTSMGLNEPAAEVAAEMGRDLLPNSDAREVTIEVKNEHRQRVITVTVAMHIERVLPSPTRPHQEAAVG
jgi:hypothetical protein